MTQKEVKQAQKLAARIEQEVEQLEAYLEEIKKHQPEQHSRISVLAEKIKGLTTATEDTVSDQIGHLWYEVKSLAGGASDKVESAYQAAKGRASGAYDHATGAGKESYHNAKENVKSSWWNTKKVAHNSWNDVFDSDEWNAYFNDKKEDAKEWKNYLEHSAYHPKHWQNVLSGQFESYRAPKPFIERQKWKLHKGADRVGNYLDGWKQSLFPKLSSGSHSSSSHSSQDAISVLTGAFALYYLLYLVRSVFLVRQRTQIHYGDGSTDLTLVRSSGTPEPYSKHDLRKRGNSDASDTETQVARVDQASLLNGVNQLQIALTQLRTFTAIYPFVFGLLALMAHHVAFVPFVAMQSLALGLIVAYNFVLGKYHGFNPANTLTQVGLQATLAAVGGVALFQGLAMLAF